MLILYLVPWLDVHSWSGLWTQGFLLREILYTEHGLGREGGKRVKNAFPSFMLSSPSPPFLASLLLFSSHFYSVSVSLCFNATAFLLLLVPASNCTEWERWQLQHPCNLFYPPTTNPPLSPPPHPPYIQLPLVRVIGAGCLGWWPVFVACANAALCLKIEIVISIHFKTLLRFVLLPVTTWWNGTDNRKYWHRYKSFVPLFWVHLVHSQHWLHIQLLSQSELGCIFFGQNPKNNSDAMHIKHS